MSEEFVTIEVNGVSLQARKGAMLIEVTDAAGIWVPRFCYHQKLSVAANCRMCLVEVEKAPKPLPACATPVMDGMKVYTDSPKAIAAQKGVMEFLLINHPLDCPICDQGGECELQDIAMGYGAGVSRFVERKRVVREKDIGPLIATDMTRCIHCTRCVRFGAEIAGLRELGATGRGEHVEIGTYVARSIVSELSGNVIDLCPVGALTARPSRYTGRSWEYVQHPAIAPHDCVGSNLYVHTIRNRVMRVVPRENEAVNEIWLADRDRFSYEGLYSADRATQPLIKGEAAEWETALEATRAGLQAVIDRHGPEAVGFLLSPSATLEELYLAQKLARGLGITNIDHRLRQADFSDQDQAPVYPWLGMPLAELEKLEAALLVGSNVRLEQPLVGHRLRKAALTDASMMFINPRDFDFRFPVAAKIIADPVTLVAALAGVAQAAAGLQNTALPDNLRLLTAGQPDERAQAMARHLLNAGRSAVLLGNLAASHPAFAQLRALALYLARLTGAALGYLPEGGNAAGAWLAGALPHRLAGGQPAAKVGLDARAMLASPLKACVLLGVEPELDCGDPAAAMAAINGAEFVAALTPFAGNNIRAWADVILPIAAFTETSGSYVNAEGRWQSFAGAVKPLGEARPAWKVLRVLGNAFDLPGFDYLDSRQVLDEVTAATAGVEPHNLTDVPPTAFAPLRIAGLVRAGDVPLYAVDATVRRAGSLQRTPLALPAAVCLHPRVAGELGLTEGIKVRVRQNGGEAVLPLMLDEGVPEGCAWIPAGLAETAGLGPAVGLVELSAG